VVRVRARSGQGSTTSAPGALRIGALPASVVRALCVLEGSDGGRAYIVGGAVRDLLLGRPTHDHDLATTLEPEEVTRVLEGAGMRVVPTGIRFGTVTAIEPGGEEAVEVTTLRSDGTYRDRRHPDRVAWTRDVEEDLARRDFTVNALAWRPLAGGAKGGGDGTLSDPFGGQDDLRRRRLRAVGEAETRLREDPLRVARLFRLAAELEFAPEAITLRAAAVVAPELRAVARERVRDELDRLLLAPGLWPVGESVARILLPAAIDEWRELTAFEESRWRGSVSPAALLDKRRRVVHKPVDLHSVLAVTRCPPRRTLVWAALLHDLGKPRTFALTDAGRVTFYGHEAVGAEMARSALTSLRMPPRLVEAACALIAVHLWPWETASAAGLRRLVRNLGQEGARDLLELHRADVEASTPAGWALYPAARAALDDALADDAPTDERSLAVDGRDVMRVLRIGAGPRVGETLHALLERVLDDPAENERTRLLLRLAERRWQ
jgi:tRNA nucleotidyltransferase (CCA-adding enzyme)